MGPLTESWWCILFAVIEAVLLACCWFRQIENPHSVGFGGWDGMGTVQFAKKVHKLIKSSNTKKKGRVKDVLKNIYNI